MCASFSNKVKYLISSILGIPAKSCGDLYNSPAINHEFFMFSSCCGNKGIYLALLEIVVCSAIDLCCFIQPVVSIVFNSIP